MLRQIALRGDNFRHRPNRTRSNLTLIMVVVLVLLPIGTPEGRPSVAHPSQTLRADSNDSTHPAPRHLVSRIKRSLELSPRRPTGYAEWMADKGSPAPLICQHVDSVQTVTTGEEGTKFAIIINSGLLESLQASIDLYALDLAGEGYDIDIYSSSAGTPEELRAFLRTLHTGGMEGCVLIGDLPVAWYEIYECWEAGWNEEFPCDLFYMDLDGVFEDLDADGLYDRHTGNTGPDIWLGRLAASTLTFGGADEVALLENYFRKNHEYRSDRAPVENRALVYTDDDWRYRADYLDLLMSGVYANHTVEADPWVTMATDYESRLPQSHELIQLWVHSNWELHNFINPAQQVDRTYNYEVRQIDPVAWFYNLCACFNSRFTSNDYLAGWYVFNATHGLAAVSSTKAGEMMYFHDYYPMLSRREPIGKALKSWFNSQACGDFYEWEQCMFYGLNLIGDPTLRISRESQSRELRYDNEWGGSGCTLPNAYDHDLCNVRFTAENDCTLETILMLANPTGSPLCRVYIWHSDGTFPSELIDSTVLPLEDVTVGYWTAIDVSGLGLTFSEGEDFHIGISVIDPDPGEAITLHAGEWTDTLPVRSSLRVGSSWMMFDDLIGGAHNFDIRAVVREEPRPEVTITTRTLPDAYVDGGYSEAAAATGGVPPYTWDLTAGSLPDGLALDPSSGVISGMATTVETAYFTVRVSDNSSPPLTDIQHLTLMTRTCVEGVDEACCCVARVGDANGEGGDEPTIGDVSAMIDAKFISGTCEGTIVCLAEADINQSGGIVPECVDVTIGDISVLIDYLFITGSSLGLPNCM